MAPYIRRLATSGISLSFRGVQLSNYGNGRGGVNRNKQGDSGTIREEEDSDIVF